MSVRSEVVQGLKQFNDRLVELMKVVRSVSAEEGSTETPESVMRLIIQTDTALQASVSKLRQNQYQQSKITLLESRIRSRETDVTDLAIQLNSAETILQQALDKTASCISAIKLAAKTRESISVHDLIDYSSKLAYTSGKAPGLNSMALGPFPSAELFPYTRLMKELIPTKEEHINLEMSMDADHPITSLLGDIATAQAGDEGDEDLADF